MVSKKIVNEQEILQWYEEGKTYSWMVDEYLRKYNIQISPSAFGNFRRLRGLERRQTRDSDLIPWLVLEKHRWHYYVVQLRTEARRREGKPLKPREIQKLDSFIANLAEANAVVHYDPDTEQGFFAVPRREGIDTDLVRVPDRKTGRESAD